MGDTTRKKIGIFDPYLDILGGGERYILTIAEYFEDYHSVDIFWPDKRIKIEVKKRLNINIDRTTIVPVKENWISNAIRMRKYDAFYFITDGSLFFYTGKNGILIIQSPLHIPMMKSPFNRAKLTTWSSIFCYSRFIQNFIEQKTIVVPPPVDTDSFYPSRKENIILSTGRFFRHLHSKKQHILVEVFINMVNKGSSKDWKLILVGSVKDSDDREYFEMVKRKAHGFPIEFVIDASFPTLQYLYSKAKIFWLATGFGEDLSKHPERAEHFGIVAVEAMSAECVPIVFDGGGLREIVNHGTNGWLFKSELDLIEYTKRMVENHIERRRMAIQAKKRSRDFSKAVFIERINNFFET